MSKMKHLLRKLHIGDHHHHGRPPPAALDPSPQTTPSHPSTSSSPSQTSGLPQETSPSENESSGNSFNFLEEEFQMQLALAISVSDPGQTCVDSETAQINAVKQISLGRSPSQSLADFLSLRYWVAESMSGLEPDPAHSALNALPSLQMLKKLLP